MDAGTSRDDTRRAILEVEDALYRAAGALVADPKELVVMSLGKIGTTMGGSASAASIGNTDTIGGIIVELVSSDARSISASEVMQNWREVGVKPAGLESLTFTGQRTGPPGGDLDIRLKGGSIEDLKQAAGDLAELLSRYAGLDDIDDNLPYSKPEVVLEVNARGRAMGFTTVDVARQVRNAIDGAIAKRFPRGDEEIRVEELARLTGLPDHLIDRPKMGFGVPVGQWLRGPLRSWADELLDPALVREQGLLNPATVERRWTAHREGHADLTFQIWSLLMFQGWLIEESI